eukprot:9568290-Lingulodinium_polyedra.AAC.1
MRDVQLLRQVQASEPGRLRPIAAILSLGGGQLPWLLRAALDSSSKVNHGQSVRLKVQPAEDNNAPA